jgi:hypothetical protein
MIFISMWIVGSSSYYIILFQMKYFSGDFFVNIVATVLSEMIAYYVGGLLYDRIGIKSTYLISYSIGVVGCLSYVLLSTTYPFLIPLLLLSSAYGFCQACMVNWLSNASLFPVIYASSTNGMCSFFSRLASIMSP